MPKTPQIWKNKGELGAIKLNDVDLNYIEERITETIEGVENGSISEAGIAMAVARSESVLRVALITLIEELTAPKA